MDTDEKIAALAAGTHKEHFDEAVKKASQSWATADVLVDGEPLVENARVVDLQAPTDYEDAIAKRGRRPPNKALVVAAHGRGVCLCYEADAGITCCLSEFNGAGTGEEEHFDVADLGLQIQDGLAGVFVCDLSLVDDGPNDWDGGAEWVVNLSNPRPATAEEWTRHVDGEWPWEPAP